MTAQERPRAVAVYCASSPGKEKAYQEAAASLGRALAEANRPLVYGGGSKGIMGIVSGTVLKGGGEVTGVVPHAMTLGGGEGDKTSSKSAPVLLNEPGREKIVVSSMHERKVEMATRAGGFIGLPGGFGTFEEIMEVITWTQIGIHNKPVVLVNVRGFYEPLRVLIKNAIRDGFINPKNETLAIFVDGPADHAEHETFDWGKASLEALDNWEGPPWAMFDWTTKVGGGKEAMSRT
ncbi:hypothetical protein DENSPDRAFT_861398 [Dentipellis sp. KUC8613]|nr:hypothetical protein DENSPDRAFT_861398 [Dentipellis sp. KUC8613]